MTHEAAREKLLDLACGELSGREATRVEAHAAGCEACRGELAELRETRRLMSLLGELPAPARGEAELLAAARAAAAESAARPRAWRLPTWFLGASAAAAALVTVTAVSYRLLAAAPARRDDPEALLGHGTVADGSAQAPAAPPNAPAPTAPAAPAPPSASAARTSRKAASSPEAAAKGAAGEHRVATLRAAPERRDDRAAERAAERVTEPGAPAAASPAPIGIADAPPARRRAAEAPEAHAFAAPAPGTSAAAPPPPMARAAAPAAEAGSTRAPAAPAAMEALARWQALRDAGRLRREAATFPDCPGESWREVEADPEGRVVRYARRGRAGGAPFDAELYYGAGGALEVVRYREARGPWRELRLPVAPGADAAIPAAVLEPRRASEARADAPPRCRG
jgi:hypothetical protein